MIRPVVGRLARWCSVTRLRLPISWPFTIHSLFIRPRISAELVSVIMRMLRQAAVCRIVFLLMQVAFNALNLEEHQGHLVDAALFTWYCGLWKIS